MRYRRGYRRRFSRRRGFRRFRTARTGLGGVRM